MIGCEQFTGRLLDLCTGCGHAGRPDPSERAVLEFRALHGLPLLPEKPKSGGPPPTTLPSPIELPPIYIRGLNFAAALCRHIGSGMKRRTTEEIAERLEICAGCEHRIESEQGLNCGQCGCACSASQDVFLNKLAWVSETCPVGNWT